jgi:cytochrome c-type biogenesis protein CcmF
VATLGRATLILALGIAVYGVVASFYGARARRPDWVQSGRRSVYALAALLTIAFAILEVAFLRSDFAYDTVASHSSTTTPTFYKAAAMWSSQEGSLLLWVWLLSLWSSLVLHLTRRRMRDIAPVATAVLLGFAAFFCALLVFYVTPFATTSPAPGEGSGLNPLLRHPSMMVHPPLLYSGYTLFTIPFAFAVGALVVRRIDAEWIGATRRFALGAWLFLGAGVLLGARWSYAELGWGGYWGWDPVENAALMPWLTGTAFLHGIMIQEKRGMLKVWNTSLVLATGILAVTGTFLVRSGILDSIHAFGASTLGVPFVVLIAFLLAGSVALVVSRRTALRSENRIDSLFSREAIFLANNLVLVGLCFVIFWGTFFPLISEAITGSEASVGGPWFSRYTVPLALALVALAGIGPLVSWRRSTLANARRTFAIPLLAGAATAGALALAGGVAHRPLALAMFGCAAFVVAGVAQELWRGARARRAMVGGSSLGALLGVVRRNRRRYGGYLVHVGIAVLFVGVAASSAFQEARDVRLSPGQSARVGDYDMRYVRATARIADDPRGTGALLSLGAVVDVRRDGRHVATLRPARGYYPSLDARDGSVGRLIAGDATSEIGLRAGLRRDLWSAIEPNLAPLRPLIRRADRVVPLLRPDLGVVALSAIASRYRADPPPATFRFITSPLVTWIWLGGLIVAGGALISLWPAPRGVRGRVASRYPVAVARELGRA